MRQVYHNSYAYEGYIVDGYNPDCWMVLKNYVEGCEPVVATFTSKEECKEWIDQQPPLSPQERIDAFISSIEE